jgi:hypothetical protein
MPGPWAQGNAVLIGVTPQKWCSVALHMGKPSLGGISLNSPSLSNHSAVSSWISGCVAGYWSQHPDQPRVGSTPVAGGPTLSPRSVRYWFAIGWAVAVAASQTVGLDITSAGKTATTDNAWCADIMFLPQPASLNAKLQAHPPAAGEEALEWLKVPAEERGDLIAAGGEPGLQQGRQQRPAGQLPGDLLHLVAESGLVVWGQCHVAAIQWPAAAWRWPERPVGVTLLLAEGLVVVVDAGDVGAGIDRGVIMLHEPGELPTVGDGDTAEAGPLAEIAQPLCCLGCGRAAEAFMVMFVDHGQEVLTAGKSLFGFDFGPEPGIGCACVAFEHLDAQVPVLDGAGDDATRAAGDEPGQRAAELPGLQPERLPVHRGDAVGAAAFAGVPADPGGQLVQLPEAAKHH